VAANSNGIVVAVEEPALLVPVQRIVGHIQVQDDLRRREDAASKTKMSNSPLEVTTRNAGEYRMSVSSITADREPTDPKLQMGLIEAVVSVPNIRRANKRVVSNGGTPGIWPAG
jgi:hypothetical protein